MTNKNYFFKLDSDIRQNDAFVCHLYLNEAFALF